MFDIGRKFESLEGRCCVCLYVEKVDGITCKVTCFSLNKIHEYKLQTVISVFSYK